MPNLWAAGVLQIRGFTDVMQSFVFLKHTGRVQREELPAKADKTPLAEVTSPGKLTLVISVSPAGHVNVSYQFKYFCSEMR